MNNDINTNSLHAKKQTIFFEKGYQKFFRKISTLNHRKWKYIVSFPFFLYFISVFILDFNYIATFIVVLIIIFSILLLKLYYKPMLEDIHKIGIIDDKGKYYLHLGDSTRSISLIRDPSIVKKDTPEVLDYPILIDFDISLRHMLVVGTTGSGKTVFLIYLLQQHLEMGGGAMIVDGKGDKDIYTAVYNTCVHTFREDDFFVMNFNVPSESNTMNPLLNGTADEIIDIIGNMLETGGDNAFWAGRALSMMKGLLSVVVPLRDENKLYDASSPPGQKHAPMFSFKVLNKWLDLANLVDLYFYIKNNWNKNTSNSFIELDRLEAYLSSCSVPLAKKAEISDSMSKMHGNSNTMWGEALDLFMGTFGDIFNTDAPDIDMDDIVRNSRILYVLLPATKKDPRTLTMLGKLILAFFKASVATLLGDSIAGTIEERAGSSAIRPRIPFWGVMDEYGAYATEGFDNVLAQARSLRVSITLMVQETASLEKSGGGLIDKKRLLGNTGVKVILKIEEDETAEEIIKFFGEQDVAQVKFQDEKAEHLTFDVQRRAILDKEMLKNMVGGQGYIAFSGHITAMLGGWYEPPNARAIEKFEEFRSSGTQNYIMKEMISNVKQMYFVDSNKTIKEKQENIDLKAKPKRKTEKENIKKYGSKFIDSLNMDVLTENINIQDIKLQEFDGTLVLNKMDSILNNLNKNLEEIDDEEDQGPLKKLLDED